MARGLYALRMALACVVLLSHAAAAWQLPRAFTPPTHTLHGKTAKGRHIQMGSRDGGVMEQVLFVEVGFGSDQHGQDATAIEFNSIPSIRRIVPGGYENMKLRVQIAIPADESEIDLDAVAKVFPYGQLLPIEIQRGGMRASSGIAIPELGDKDDTMVIAIACVTVGY